MKQIHNIWFGHKRTESRQIDDKKYNLISRIIKRAARQSDLIGVCIENVVVLVDIGVFFAVRLPILFA